MTALAVVALCTAPVFGQAISNQPWPYAAPVIAYPAQGGFVPAYGPGGYYVGPGLAIPAAYRTADSPTVPTDDSSVVRPAPSSPSATEGTGGTPGLMGDSGAGGGWHGHTQPHGCTPLRSVLGLLAPYSEGGRCTPHWFDVHMEAVFLQRNRVSDRVDFTSLGVTVPGADPDIVLSSDSLDLSTAPGLRVTGVLQTGAASSLELTYLGLTHWSDAASVSDEVSNLLFSPFSDFGRRPPAVPYFGYVDVDAAYYHSIALKSVLDSIELNYRRRWVGPSCMLQGSWLAGFRYFQLRESLEYITRTHNLHPDASEGYCDYTVGTANHLYGFQGGGDAWLCIVPGLEIGVEGKAGIYGNDARQRTSILANSIDPPLLEAENNTRASFVSELDFMVTYRLNPKFTVRGGYMLMWADGLALAVENFNSAPPNAFDPIGGGGIPGPVPERVVSLKDSGHVFWHGWTVGAEYMW